MPLPGPQFDARSNRNTVVIKARDCTTALLQRARQSRFLVRYLGDEVEFRHRDKDEVERFRSFVRSVRRPS